MGRSLLFVLVSLLVAPLQSHACDGEKKGGMELQVRQVGPPVKIKEKVRGTEFIVFRGDMIMQKEEARMAEKEHQKHRPAVAISGSTAKSNKTKKMALKRAVTTKQRLPASTATGIKIVAQ